MGLNYSNLHFTKLGQGPHILLALHGIGQDGLGCFAPFETELGQYYTIYAFDLFFHGKNANTEVKLVSKELWKRLLTDFLIENQIERFDIAGFSMGGRFALATLEAFPNKIDKAYLIAPDGISENPLYSLATRNLLGRAAFRQIMQAPFLFFKTISFLRTINILNKSLVRFTEQMLNTVEKRELIYKSWTGFRNLRFDIPKIARIAQQHNCTIYLFSGEFDKLLNPKTVSKLSRLLPPGQHIRLKSGHSQLVGHAAKWICTLFQ